MIVRQSFGKFSLKQILEQIEKKAGGASRLLVSKAFIAWGYDVISFYLNEKKVDYSYDIRKMNTVYCQFVYYGLNNSAVSGVPEPPTTNTFPFVNVQALCWFRCSFMLAVTLQVSVDGSYSSAPLVTIP